MPKKAKVPMSSGLPMDLRVRHSILSGKASLPLLQRRLLLFILLHQMLFHNLPLAITTAALLRPLHRLLLSHLLTRHHLPSSQSVANVNILLASLPTLCPTHLSMTSCPSRAALLARPTKSDRRSPDQQPSYRPAMDSRTLIIPSK